MKKVWWFDETVSDEDYKAIKIVYKEKTQSNNDARRLL